MIVFVLTLNHAKAFVFPCVMSGFKGRRIAIPRRQSYIPVKWTQKGHIFPISGGSTAVLQRKQRGFPPKPLRLIFAATVTDDFDGNKGWHILCLRLLALRLPGGVLHGA